MAGLVPMPPSAAGEASVVDEQKFRQLVACRGQELFRITQYLQRQALDGAILTRPLLGEILSKTAQLEELLDAYGARQNCQWYAFRRLIATAKIFAAAGYKLLHIEHSWKSYHLLEVEGDLGQATKDALLFVGNAVMQVACSINDVAEELDVAMPLQGAEPLRFEEDLLVGRLKADRTARHVESAEETVAHLATAFLKLAAASEVLHTPTHVQKDEYATCIPDPVSEEKLRRLEHWFHNMQSMYDTYVLDTDTEKLDPDLCVLRGHVSLIFHLLEVSTLLVHYYERHMRKPGSSHTTSVLARPLMDPRALVALLMDFALLMSSRYLKAAKELCQCMLRRYARIEEIELSVPRYRGFHVRPSTLLSRICHHYGSEVQMDLDGEIYDASAPLDLFRANEKINARKRRMLAAEIASVHLDLPKDLGSNMIAAVRQMVAALAAKGRLVIYERPLPLEDMEPHENESLAQFAVDEITRLLALGKIDIESDVSVRFIGDERVLSDIRLLAENGYGEDAFGNNIPLPSSLSYLRH